MRTNSVGARSLYEDVPGEAFDGAEGLREEKIRGEVDWRGTIKS